MQFAFLRSTPKTQRRFLRSSNANHKPPSGVAATQYQSQYIPAYEAAPAPKPRLRGGWAKSSSAVELTPEEAAMRRAIQQNHPSPSAQNPEPSFRKIGFDRFDRFRDAETQPGVRRNPYSQESPTRRRDASEWRCSSCGYDNLRSGSRCTECNSFNAEESKSGQITWQRKHVQRYGQEAEPEPLAPKRRKQLNEPVGVEPLAFEGARGSGEEVEIGRRRRLEQTRGGRFVGFRAGQHRDEPEYSESPPRAVPLRRLQSSRHPTDRPLTDAALQSNRFSGESGSFEQRSVYPQRQSNVDRSSTFTGSLQDYEYGQQVGEPRLASHTAHNASLKDPESFREAYNAAADTWSDESNAQRPPFKSGDLSRPASDGPSYRTDPSGLHPSADAAASQPNHLAPAASPRASTATTRYIPLGGTQNVPPKLAQDAEQSPPAVSEPWNTHGRLDDGPRTRGNARDSEYAPSPRFATQKSAPYFHEQRSRRPRRVREDYDEEDDEYDEDREDREEARRKRKQQRKHDQAAQKRAQPPTPIYLPDFISIGNLASVLRVRVEDFGKKIESLGFEETNNDHLLDAEVAGLIAAEFNFEAIVDTSGGAHDLQSRPPAEDKSILPPRPPIVTIMGHVDHGKTTLLDYLRKSSVAASEHGGITQHIGAFSVSMPGGRLITFLDTPGHAAFLSMRQRGANVTDIVILVVAADDSVKPQTVEAIKHAQAAKVPMIVAINKVDKEDKDIDRVKQDLARYNVEIEDFGGDTQVVCVSGKTGQGLDELEENIVALADILDMRAEVDGQAEGWVLEAATKKGGRVATVLVKRGIISRGDIIVAGSTWAKVKTLRNEAGVQVEQAAPGTPVEVDGWKDQPTAGDEVLQATSEQQAKSAIDRRLAQAEKERMAADIAAVNESRRLEQEKREREREREALSAETDSPDSTSTDTTDSRPLTTTPAEDANTSITLPILLKADVSGSVEACLNAITGLGTPAISPRVLRYSVGPISESDIAFAASSGANVVSFNQRTTPEVYRLAEKEDVKLVEENVIYRLSDLVKGKLQDLLPDKIETRVLGEAEIARGFEIGVGGRKKATVAGCRIRNGLVSRANKVKVLRGGEGGEVVFDGPLKSLKIVKKDVTEARKGGECGMSFEGWEAFKEGDMVQSYEEKRVKPTL